MAISRVKGNDDGFLRASCASTAFAVGDLAAFDRSGAVVVKATSSTSVEDLAGIVVEATTTSDTSVLLQKINELDEVIANLTNNSSATHNYQRMVLTNEHEVNNTGTDSTADGALFMQLATVGAAADKKARGRLVRVQDRA